LVDRLAAPRYVNAARGGARSIPSQQEEWTMAKKDVQGFMKGQLGMAQKRLVAFEAEAEKVLKNLIARGQDSRKELDVLLERLSGAELKVLNGSLRELIKRAQDVSQDARKKLEEFQARILQVAGVASQNQVRALNRQLSKLSRRVDSIDKPEARA
jgi:vacuolar-type H+-ATPase subunit D/Vma8